MGNVVWGGLYSDAIVLAIGPGKGDGFFLDMGFLKTFPGPLDCFVQGEPDTTHPHPPTCRFLLDALHWLFVFAIREDCGWEWQCLVCSLDNACPMPV